MEIRTDYLIIGGGIAGTTAAETIRERDSRAKIALLGKENHFLYSRVLLPKYLQGTIRREQVYLRNLADYTRRAVDLYLGEEVTKLDPLRKEVTTGNGNVYSYDKLLIAAGGRTQTWDRPPGVDFPTFRLQTIEDADVLVAAMPTIKRKEALVVGGGFIGMEMVNSLVANGFHVDLLIKNEAYWNGQLGKEGNDFLDRVMNKNGVTVFKNNEVTVFLKGDEEGMIQAQLKFGKAIHASLVGIGVGLVRNFEIFQGGGFAINRGILANEYLETGVRDVWTAGDIAEYHDIILNQPTLVGNWTSSFLQGRAAGLNMAASGGMGEKAPFRSVASYAITVLQNHMTFLGDTMRTEGIVTIPRLVEEKKSYERLFIANDRLIGALLINKFEDKVKLQSWIETGVSMVDKVEALHDPNTDLRQLP